ncbi:MAG: dipeptide epimerase [Candidatus Eiseniibacteriota bacterium]|nr:MAG: dipeptide epimerase [Candidatus Eisenbacteria bacterium]
MHFSFEPLTLRTRHVFAISRGAADTFGGAVVRIEDGGLVGLGEAAPSPFYGETQATVLAAIELLKKEIPEDPFQLEELAQQMNRTLGRNPAAKAAIDIALHDLVCKKLGVPLHSFLGFSADKTPCTSFTIGIDDVETMKQRAIEATDFSVLKIKVGTDRDERVLEAIRSVTDMTLRVDANCAWSPREAVQRISALEKFDIEFVEQPIPPGDPGAMRFVRENVSVPLIADESVETSSDIRALVGAVDGINIKLMKCGGVREALKMIHVARATGMKVMLGCMVESSIGISAAAHLSPGVDYADLDGNLLLATDPYVGVQVKQGRLVLPSEPGLGVRAGNGA